MQGIYIINNVINSKIYVGSAMNILKRWTRHRHDLNNNKHHNRHLQRAWNKYGRDNFVFSIIEDVIDENILLEREQYHMDTLCACDTSIGYNMNPTAGSSLGIKRSDEFKQKLRLANLGKIESDETRRRKREVALGNPKYSRNMPKGGDSHRSVTIEQYTKDNVFVKEWSSLVEARDGVGAATHAEHIVVL